MNYLPIYSQAFKDQAALARGRGPGWANVQGRPGRTNSLVFDRINSGNIGPPPGSDPPIFGDPSMVGSQAFDNGPPQTQSQGMPFSNSNPFTFGATPTSVGTGNVGPNGFGQDYYGSRGKGPTGPMWGGDPRMRFRNGPPPGTDPPQYPALQSALSNSYTIGRKF